MPVHPESAIRGMAGGVMKTDEREAVRVGKVTREETRGGHGLVTGKSKAS
jgi:hypothetical protein